MGRVNSVTCVGRVWVEILRPVCKNESGSDWVNFGFDPNPTYNPILTALAKCYNNDLMPLLAIIMLEIFSPYLCCFVY